MPRNDATNQLIQELVMMRIRDAKSLHEILFYLTIDKGFTKSYSYDLWNHAKEQIEEIQKEMAVTALTQRIADLERVLETARKEKNRRIELDTIKELNKICGLNKEHINVDVTNKFVANWGGQTNVTSGTASTDWFNN